MMNQPELEYRFPKEAEALHMKQKIVELKDMIKSKHPEINLSEYSFQDHVEGRCDYNSIDLYEAEYHDEANSFGHLLSENI